MKTWIAPLLLTLGLIQPAFAAWNLNDVSYLMPLPTQIGPDNLLGLEAPGNGGPLLPRGTMGTIPPLSPVMTEADAAENLRVIAVRIDPCFPLPTPQACQKQIRLVWQPLEPGFRNKVQTVDAALHSFYVLTDAEFDGVLKDLAAWKKRFNVSTDNLPLQVHPAWKQQGDQSPAFLEFNSIVKKYAGVARLTRVTVMVVRGAGDMWTFQGYDFENGRLKLFKIPRTDRSAQTFINFAVPSDHFQRGMISPAPAGDDAITKVISNSDRLKVGNEDLILKELRAMHRAENPHNFNPENMDCATCHVALPARVWLENNRKDLPLGAHADAFAYKNPNHNMENKSTNIKNTQIIRAFGYFGEEVAISQRVIHESAAVADQINSYLKTSK